MFALTRHPLASAVVVALDAETPVVFSMKDLDYAIQV